MGAYFLIEIFDFVTISESTAGRRRPMEKLLSSSIININLIEMY